MGPFKLVITQMSECQSSGGIDAKLPDWESLFDSICEGFTFGTTGDERFGLCGQFKEEKQELSNKIEELTKGSPLTNSSRSQGSTDSDSGSSLSSATSGDLLADEFTIIFCEESQPQLRLKQN
jgi:hypothetical protein